MNKSVCLRRRSFTRSAGLEKHSSSSSSCTFDSNSFYHKQRRYHSRSVSCEASGSGNASAKSSATAAHFPSSPQADEAAILDIGYETSAAPLRTANQALTKDNGKNNTYEHDSATTDGNDNSNDATVRRRLRIAIDIDDGTIGDNR